MELDSWVGSSEVFSKASVSVVASLPELGIFFLFSPSGDSVEDLPLFDDV